MRAGLYEFKSEHAYQFLRHVGIDKIRRTGDELHAIRCPYCNGGASGDKYTFAINLNTGQFNCLRSSCSRKGNMIDLSKDFDFSLGKDIDAYYRKVERFKDLRNIKIPKTRYPAVEYMNSRGISKETTERYGLTTKENQPNILAFPFVDEKGILQFIKYRKTDFDKSNDNNKEWCASGCKPILFGMNQCNADESKTLVMTEGQIDSLSVTESGIPNAVSVPTGKNGFTWFPYCWDFLCQFDELIIFGDCENGEITLLKEMTGRFNGTIKHVRVEDYLDCKDANEILNKHGKYAVVKAVENAVMVENPRIKRLANVQRQEVSNMEKFSSGIPSLDSVLGGLYLGQLILLTGERGRGKSTLASQIGTFAIQSGYPVFFYSGELMDWMFNDWFLRQIAGGRNVCKKIEPNGFTNYSVYPSVVDKIFEWYYDKAFLYDNNIISDTNDEINELPDALGCAIKQYGCKVLVIDNLMTAMSDDMSSDLYRQQSNFVKTLARMAKRFDVLIILIAHPRKSNGTFRNDDVSGSANITNLCDVVMRYGLPDEAPEDCPDRTLQVTKNRLTGRLTSNDGILLHFDQASKRISEFDTFDWKLGWEKDTEQSFESQRLERDYEVLF